MPKLSWRSALLVLMLPLGLAACGNGDDTPTTGEGESQEPAQETTQTGEPAASEDPASDAPDTGPDAEEQGSEQLATEQTSPDDQTGAGLSAASDEEVAADTDTLGQSPADTLEEGAALPGETTRDEVDAMIEETERRFEEASRRIDEQFEAAEQAPLELDPMDSSTELMPSGDPMDEIEGASTLDDGPRPDDATDVDAFLEEQERRFEEAQRRLEEQFEEVENGNLELEPIESNTVP